MFKEALENENLSINTKGGLYYPTTYNSNLDLFVLGTRFKFENELIALFDKAYLEDKILATAILLYNLDIRDGKGERRVFKILFHHLCKLDIEFARKVLYLIPELGRYDYILETKNTNLWNDTIKLIRDTLDEDLKVNNPSLLAKWLPSIRTHNKNNPLAKDIAHSLNMSEKEYRKMLSTLRDKIKVVEKYITNKDYSSIEYESIPSIAMSKYHSLFKRSDSERFNSYLDSLKNGERKVNASVLEPYQILKQALGNTKDNSLLDELWRAQKDVLANNNKNALVIADTSGSMFSYDRLPICTVLSLAIYIAERNKGIFHNTFINFSTNPSFQELKGDTLSEKIKSINFNNWDGTTNIDKALEMILNATIKSNKDECPSHLIIISDMEFDKSISKKTNYNHWKELYQMNNITMPTIVFWCVSPNQLGIPINKNDNNVCVISGFSKELFKGILDLENYSPVNVMLEMIDKYKAYLK